MASIILPLWSLSRCITSCYELFTKFVILLNFFSRYPYLYIPFIPEQGVFVCCISQRVNGFKISKLECIHRLAWVRVRTQQPRSRSAFPMHHLLLLPSSSIVSSFSLLKLAATRWHRMSWNWFIRRPMPTFCLFGFFVPFYFFLRFFSLFFYYFFILR